MMMSLSCGHVCNVRMWPKLTVTCSDHERALLVQIVAVECREWKITCNSCRYSRWFGQDQDSANLAAAKHRHSCMIDYLGVDEKKRQVREHYGRKVKTFLWQNVNRRPGGRQFIQPSLFAPEPVTDDQEIPF